ncbi:MAG: DMT family transporter [Candidatus Gottesmanbacteria bacterium]
MTPVQKGVIGLIIANIIWGFASPIFKWSLTNIPPFTLAFLRFFIASIILGIVLRKNLALPIKDKHDVKLLIIHALTGITGNITLFFLGLQLTLAINVPVIASSQPIMIFLFAYLILKEKLKLNKVLGMIVGTIGILAIVLEPIYYAGIDGNTLGNFLIVLATISGAIAMLIGRQLFQKYDPLVLMFWAFVIGTLSFLPPALVEYIRQPTIFQTLDIRGIVGIIFGSVFSSTIAYTLYAYGLSKIQASDASLFIYIDPIAGAVLSYFMLHEPITIPFLIGAGLIFTGIYIAERRIHYHPFGKLRIKCPDCQTNQSHVK